MRRIGIGTGIIVVGIASLFALAGRSLTEIRGYAQAGADVATDGLTEAVPEEVQDRKLDQEAEKARAELIDRQTQIIAFRPQIASLETKVTNLSSRVERRGRLLAEAYPVLRQAADSELKTVVFANEEQSVAVFQRDVDELLGEQQREERQLELGKVALQHLRETVTNGEAAIAEMRNQLEQSEHTIAMLRSRREQAEIESSTLSLIAAATADRESVVGLMSSSITRLENDVAELESRNQARRAMSVKGNASPTNRLARHWERLEQLENIHGNVTGVNDNQGSVETATADSESELTDRS